MNVLRRLKGIVMGEPVDSRYGMTVRDDSYGYEMLIAEHGDVICGGRTSTLAECRRAVMSADWGAWYRVVVDPTTAIEYGGYLYQRWNGRWATEIWCHGDRDSVNVVPMGCTVVHSHTDAAGAWSVSPSITDYRNADGYEVLVTSAGLTIYWLDGECTRTDEPTTYDDLAREFASPIYGMEVISWAELGFFWPAKLNDTCIVLWIRYRVNYE